MLRLWTVAFLVACCWAQTTAQESDRVFIPHTPLTEQELDAYKVELIRDHGWSGSTAEEFVRGASREHHRFTDDDLRRAFPEIGPDDQQASLCGNSMMSGATRLVYISPPFDHLVTVKATMCSPVEGGLSCSALSEYESYFFETPEQRFTLDDGVSLEEAKKLLTIFRDHGLEGLPDWYQRQRFGYQDVNNIGKDGDVYTLHLGEFFCRGCTATFKVRIDTRKGGDPALMLVEEPEGMCI
jgi:hypothetical protein